MFTPSRQGDEVGGVQDEAGVEAFWETIVAPMRMRKEPDADRDVSPWLHSSVELPQCHSQNPDVLRPDVPAQGQKQARQRAARCFTTQTILFDPARRLRKREKSRTLQGCAHSVPSHEG